MAHRASAHEPHPGPALDTSRTDYTGAIYGSLLAASVVAGAGAVGPHPRAELVALLLCTGVVFWAAHAYVRFIGNRLRHRSVTWGEIRRVCAGEWPIVQAAFLPAVAVAISPILGLGAGGAGWLALGVAVAQQVGWATVMVIRAGASHGAVVSVAAVNLVLGLVIVAAKVALH
ncbi:hypothetical protein GFH48_26220 [Streptomyces fagopyri]|uniref:Integral membrane protein n=1 Tax=Streptomyces fagopyri TaxID=2662397 RepID=A0A5Q0LGP4_9ACTN|nr:hypothetical protein [Streptomyces fagopyri]QFZ76295.1 hypothetical protein GFH48_26220 [Streptomyces fagopyri]